MLSIACQVRRELGQTVRFPPREHGRIVHPLHHTCQRLLVSYMTASCFASPQFLSVYLLFHSELLLAHIEHRWLSRVTTLSAPYLLSSIKTFRNTSPVRCLSFLLPFSPFTSPLVTLHSVSFPSVRGTLTADDNDTQRCTTTRTFAQ